MSAPVWEPTDRRLNILLVTVATTLAILLVFALVQLRVSFGTRDNSAVVVRSNELASCRDEARVEVDLANLAVELAAENRDAAVVDGLVALSKSDGAAFNLAVTRSIEAQATTTLAMTKKIRVVDDYRAAVALSREDPDKFLSDCKG